MGASATAKKHQQREKKNKTSSQSPESGEKPS